MPVTQEQFAQAAVQIAQALDQAGFTLGLISGGAGQEDLLNVNTVQVWAPGQTDVDGNVQTEPAAQFGIWSETLQDYVVVQLTLI